MNISGTTRPRFTRLLALIVALWCGAAQATTTLFQDGFESGSLSAAWTTGTTNEGRVTISTNLPATGLDMLQLDDAVNDTIYSVASAFLHLDLTNKKNVVLSFRAKSLGNSPDPPTASNSSTTIAQADAVSISMDGTTWIPVYSLAYEGTSWTQHFVSLDNTVTPLGVRYGSTFQIRFSQYGKGPAGVDGMAIDDVMVTGDDDQRIQIIVPPTVTEGDGPHTGTVRLSIPLASPVTLTLSTEDNVGYNSGVLSFPATVTIPAGQTSVDFQFSAVDNHIVNLTRREDFTTYLTGATTTDGYVNVLDDEPPPVATLSLPAMLAEGTGTVGMLSIDRTASQGAVFSLTASPASEISYMPSTVAVPAGATSASFTIQAKNDGVIDGNVPVTFTLTATNSTIATVTGQMTVIDQQNRNLVLALPATVLESGTATGTVTISGTLPANLVVGLASSNTSALTVPASVTILAGQTQASFTLAAPNNTVKDGSRTVNVTASAPTFVSATQAVTVRDNEPAGYAFATIADIINPAGAVAVTITTADVEGNGFTGGPTATVSLSVVLPDGTTQALTPATVTLVSGTWSGSITLPTVPAKGLLRLRAADAAGNSGLSNPFEASMRTMGLTVQDLVWDPLRSRIYASVTSSTGGTYNGAVVAIDPATLQVTASVSLTNQGPRKLAITSGGEYLYVALQAAGLIGKIDLGTMTLVSSFSISSSALQAASMITVAGQPNILMVALINPSTSPSFYAVQVYNNGVAQQGGPPGSDGSTTLCATDDPTVFFGYDNESSAFGLSKFILGAPGITGTTTSGTLLDSFDVDIRSTGGKVYSGAGEVVDATQMARLGAISLPTGGGPLAADATSGLVFFMEPQVLNSSSYDKIGGYGLDSLLLHRRLSFAPAATAPHGFIRWGTDGLAFATSTNVVLIGSPQLVPGDLPADLALTVQASSQAVASSAPVAYAVQVTNKGPNTAHDVQLRATLSAGQTLQGTTTSSGTAVTTGGVVLLPVGDLAMGATATLTLSTLPQSPGSVTCSASAGGSSFDPDQSNNAAFCLVNAGYQSLPDMVNRVRLTASNIIYDSVHKVLWATIPAAQGAPLGRSLISLNPLNGQVGAPVALNGDARPGCFALSANARYLYVGLTDAPEVVRFDMATVPPVALRIPLALSQWGNVVHAEEIQVLDGDGTSFLMTEKEDGVAAVYDGIVLRPNRTAIYTVDNIERTSTPGIFNGLNQELPDTGTVLSVTASGVSVVASSSDLFSGNNINICGSGGLLLSSTGELLDPAALVITAALGVAGRPCLDAGNQRAFIVNGSAIWGFNTATGLAVGSLALPTIALGDWAQSCVRWGVDGLAVLGNDGMIYIARWSQANTTDLNANGIPDTWEMANFNSLAVDMNADADGDGISNAMEYLFGTSPTSPSGNPLHIVLSTGGLGMQVQAQGLTSQSIRLGFPRRAGLPAGFYRFDSTSDLQTWSPVQGVSETVVSTATVGGVAIENVEAVVPLPAGGKGFVRMVTTGP